MDKRLVGLTQKIRSKIFTGPIISIMPQLPHLILNILAVYIKIILPIQN